MTAASKSSPCGNWTRGIHALAFCLLGVFFSTGCDGHKTAASSATPEASAPRPPVLFEGVIKAKEQRDLALNSSEITYTITKGKIRRETKPTTPLGRIADLGTALAGVICDVPNDQVILYRRGLAGKFFVRMTLEAYRKQVGTSIAGLSDVREDVLPLKPLLWKHIGTFFAYLPKPLPGGHAQNSPAARTVTGRLCDVLIIPLGDTAYEICHDPVIAFDRPLLELVEVGLPAEVTGFPVQMRRLQAVTAPPVDQSQSKAWQLLKKGAQVAARVAEKAMKYDVDLVSVTEGSPPDAAFTLDGSFIELATWDEFELKFDPPDEHHHHSHHDWD